MSLALATLIYEWRRYMAAIIALAFSGLLILAQVGMFSGIGAAFTATIDRSRADVLILSPKAEALFGGGSGVSRRVMPQIYMNPEVEEVADLDGDGGMWINRPKDGQVRKREFVQIFCVDPYPGAVTLPIDYSEQIRQALLEPYTVAIDETALARLGVKLGDKATLNGHTVKVGAVLSNYPNMVQATVIMSRDTLRLLGLRLERGPGRPADGQDPTPGAGRRRPGSVECAR